MRSVADQLRVEDRERMRALTPAERLKLSLRLGEADVVLYAPARGLSAAKHAPACSDGVSTAEYRRSALNGERLSRRRDRVAAGWRRHSERADRRGGGSRYPKKAALPGAKVCPAG